MHPENQITEDFLHYIWENRLFETEKLQTACKKNIKIIDTGQRNTDSGPDFFNAKIKIAKTIWAGNIEIHLKASGWKAHKHHLDKAYDNVILHVTKENDYAVQRSNGENIPTIELKYPQHLESNYQKLLSSKTWIPCQDRISEINPLLLQLGYNRLMVERLQLRTKEIEDRLILNKNDWNETFYQMLAKMFGFKVNSAPFELLAKNLPYKILSKHSTDLFQIEALLFGCSGLLNKQLLGDDYYIKLREEYSFLYKKYKLRGIESHLWKFMRLRPVNFPTIRIAQFAALINNSQGLFSKITESSGLKSIKELLNAKASEYWDTHYNFNQPSKGNSVRKLGESSVNILIINVIIPVLFVAGELQNKSELKNRALEFLEQIPPENNTITRKWAELGVYCHNAFESQALLQLKKLYCEKKKCLNCQIGVNLIKALPKNKE